MTQDKGVFINEIRDGQAVEGVFLVKELHRGETRAGKPYLRLTLCDRSGEIGGPIWDDADNLAPFCQPGSFIFLTGMAENYRGALQLKINAVRAVEAAMVKQADFIPSAPVDPAKMAAELAKQIKSVKHPLLRKLLNGFFQNPEFAARFARAGAAKTMHHAYLGGLLEHTLGLVRLADAVAGLYPAIDRDLLLAGAMLHDIGKVEELAQENYPFDYTDRGRLVGHLVIGAEMIGQKAAAIPGFPSDLRDRLQHLILSHHGRHEFGAPTLPMLQEAFVLHFLDDLDAKLNYFDRLSRQASTPGYQWTDYQRNLERFLFVQGRPAGENDPPAENERQQGGGASRDRLSAADPEAPAQRQKTLWD